MTPCPNHTPKEGLVFNIQRFSVHDGPGIRTTVFMKGCPLNCLWCSNPESQDSSPNLIVRDIQCRGCGKCAEVCPQGAIRLDGDQARRIDRTKCNECLACVPACLYGSLNGCGTYMSVEQILHEVMRDEPFYKNSGGGITVSGGEPLSQPEFVADLLKASKEAGLHTVLDTTGLAPWETIQTALSLVDLVLWDIKHLDPQEHRRTTGVDNGPILDNLAKASRFIRVWIRLPLIAGFNDSDAHIREVASLARDLKVEKVSLLPYHEGGISKCEQLGRPYPFPEGATPAPEHTDRLKTLVEKEGVKASIGS